MRKIFTLLLLTTACVLSTTAQDAKEYKTYVKNDRLVHYCNHEGITVIVDVTESGLFEPHISIINDTGHEFLFEPKKIKAYCYALKNQGSETRNRLARYFDLNLDKSPLEKDSLRVYTYEKYSRKQSNAIFWGNLLAQAIVGAVDAVAEPNTPEGRYWARAHQEEMATAGEASRRFELQRINESYWRANTIFDMTEHCGFIGLKRRKADHIVLEIPVNGDVYTFLIDDRKKY